MAASFIAGRHQSTRRIPLNYWKTTLKTLWACIEDTSVWKEYDTVYVVNYKHIAFSNNFIDLMFQNSNTNKKKPLHFRTYENNMKYGLF